MKALFEVVIGTYEEFLLGYKFQKESSELVQSFATHSHSSSIRTVATCEKLLASGGADDRIIIYNFKTRKEQCILTHHDGTVNCLAFTPDNLFLISGSADGLLAITNTSNWTVEKLWKDAHEGSAILAIAVHPTGKLALTLGADCKLRTWNLVKGRQAYVINLRSKSTDARSLEFLEWSPTATSFILAGGKYTEKWCIEKGTILLSVTHSSKVTCCRWFSDRKLLVGYEDGKLGQVNLNNGETQIIHAHNSRVKSLCLYEKYIVTAASDGEVKLWGRKFNKLGSCNVGCRIICTSVISNLE